ncbi:Uncharacterised protein [Streptococcus suis]|nr:Uncharacterised protein [Streptococcus suis]
MLISKSTHQCRETCSTGREDNMDNEKDILINLLKELIIKYSEEVKSSKINRTYSDKVPENMKIEQ